MVRLFRVIRQRLLTENRASKYFLYALGEILLVVIGILIALQVNNWNEDRKKNNLKASYKISLINDLELDTLTLGKMIEQNAEALDELGRQRQRMLGPQTPMDTLIKILRKEFDPELNTRFQYHRNTLNTLIASGNIDLFSRELNDGLMALNSMQDLERENARYYREIYSSKITRFSDDFPVSGHQNSSIVNFIWTDIDQRKLASGFLSLTDIKAFAHHAFIEETEGVKKEAILLLEKLKSTD